MQKEKQLTLTETATFKAVPGHGIEATIDHHHILVGNRKLMADNDISLPKHISDDLTHYERMVKLLCSLLLIIH